MFHDYMVVYRSTFDGSVHFITIKQASCAMQAAGWAATRLAELVPWESLHLVKIEDRPLTHF